MLANINNVFTHRNMFAECPAGLLHIHRAKFNMKFRYQFAKY